MPPSLEFAAQIRRALETAGFTVVNDAESGRPGLRVQEDAAGVMVSWTASHGFEALADQSRSSANEPAAGDSMRDVIEAALIGLLTQLGHTVEPAPENNGLRVRPAPH
ncbi:hypothetical protein ACFYQQ_28415 [Streptomyces sp. NPDC005496]|uniref:hypothetical protein n=1 Tax=unclassified Streptomyces TaxID=2593676 RepID=UPI0033A6C4E3